MTATEQQTITDILAESVADSFETMAFLSPMQLDASAVDGAPAPQDATLLTMPFRGKPGGFIEMIAPRRLGRLASCNMLGDDADTDGHGEDALKELLNVFCGLALRRYAAESGAAVEMFLPQIRPFDGPADDWAGFARSPGTLLLDVEGETVAVRVRTATTDQRGEA